MRHRVVIFVAVALVAASSCATASAGAYASKAKPPRHRGGHTSVNPAPLWSTFPLGRRAVSSEHALENAPHTVQTPPRSVRPTRTASHIGDVIVATLVTAAVLLVLALVIVRARRRRRRDDSRVDEQRSRAVALTNDWMHPDAARPQIADGAAREPATASEGETAAGDSPEVDGRRDGHLLFVPTTDGYRLIERPGAAPAVRREVDGEELGVDGRFRVSKIVTSPLPSDERECAYLERA